MQGAMKRGGYDGIRPDEALKQARERGEDVGWDLLFGIAGSLWEGLWLAVLTASVAYLAGHALLTMNPLLLVLAIPSIAALIATRAAGWLVTPYADSIFRRLLWGLAAAALLLLLVRAGLAAILLIRLRLEGLDAEAAGVEAFHVAAKFTLAIAMPVWLLYAIWGWLRRRSLPKSQTAAAWRRWLPIMLVLATMIFLAREGAYFDSLKPR
jgi:hypothetical protein